MGYKIATCLLLALIAVPLPAAIQASDPLTTDIEQLQRWRYSASPLPLGAGGFTWTHDTASLTLESGRLWLQEPTADGAQTGLVFEGQGRFRMTVPDPLELANLRRRTDDETLEALDVRVKRLVLRTSEDFLAPLAAGATTAYKPNKLAAKRHEHWLRSRWQDVDARVLTGLAEPRYPYVRIDMETAEHGWLTYEYDTLEAEEIRLAVFKQQRNFLEVWVSLDRPEERAANGRPSRHRRGVIDLEHVEVEADLTRPGKDAQQGINRLQPINGRFAVTLTFRGVEAETRVLPLRLFPPARVDAVTDEDGTVLPFLRDHIGDRSSILDDRAYDDDLVVFLDRPLAQGEQRRLRFEYEAQILNYGAGRFWYPGRADSYQDLHTAHLTLTVPKRYALRAMGERLTEQEEGKTTTSTWQIEQPVKMATFVFGKHFEERSIQPEGLPEIVTFSARDAKTASIAEDVAASAAYFQEIFGPPTTADRLYVTSIVGGHGQSFDGFLHLTESTFALESGGPSERFRAHEVAHQWWGHTLGFASYRDQWLSEGFAEYAALMFLEARVEDGPKYLQQILRAYTAELTGSIKESLSRFTRPWLVHPNANNLRQLGPLVLGPRAATAEVPLGGIIQSYHRGALVLHMLRNLLRERSGDDALFHRVLRTFLDRYRGGAATTDDFEAVLNAESGDDWRWFFAQWIESTALPTYRWRATLPERPDADDRWPITLEVRQEDVPDDFRMEVPVEVTCADGSTERSTVWIAGATSTPTLHVAAQPTAVAFNPENAVLAIVKKR